MTFNINSRYILSIYTAKIYRTKALRYGHPCHLQPYTAEYTYCSKQLDDPITSSLPKYVEQQSYPDPLNGSYHPYLAALKMRLLISGLIRLFKPWSNPFYRAHLVRFLSRALTTPTTTLTNLSQLMDCPGVSQQQKHMLFIGLLIGHLFIPPSIHLYIHPSIHLYIYLANFYTIYLNTHLTKAPVPPIRMQIRGISLHLSRSSISAFFIVQLSSRSYAEVAQTLSFSAQAYDISTGDQPKMVC